MLLFQTIHLETSYCLSPHSQPTLLDKGIPRRKSQLNLRPSNLISLLTVYRHTLKAPMD